MRMAARSWWSSRANSGRGVLAPPRVDARFVVRAEVEGPRDERVERSSLVFGDAFVSPRKARAERLELTEGIAGRREGRAEVTDLHLGHPLARVAEAHEVHPTDRRRVEPREERVGPEAFAFEAR